MISNAILRLALALLLIAPLSASAQVIIDFNDSPAGTLAGDTYTQHGVEFSTVPDVRGSNRAGAVLSIVGDARPEISILDYEHSPSLPNLVAPSGSGDVLMDFTGSGGVTAIRVALDNHPESGDIVRLYGLAAGAAPNEFRILAVDEDTDDGTGKTLSVASDGRPFDYALFEITTELEGFDDLTFTVFEPDPRAEVERLVEGRLAAWSQRGKFEKVEDYEARVNDETRAAVRDSLTAQALAEVGEERIDWGTARNTYDPDREAFTITVEHLAPFVLAVPIAEAEAFDANFRGVQYLSPVYGLGNGDGLSLEYVEVTDPASGRTYVYERP